MITKEHIIRRHLELYSMDKFAKLLWAKKYHLFYPFKDKGIDMISLKDGQIEYYQLKARNEPFDPKWKNQYWFDAKSNIKNIKERFKDVDFEKVFFIFCALQSNKEFHFFKVPLAKVEEYFEIRGETNKESTFDIERLNEDEYSLLPKTKNFRFNINEYRLEK